MKNDKLYLYMNLSEVQAQINERDAEIKRNREIIDIVFTALAYAGLIAAGFTFPMMIVSWMN